MPNTVFDAKFYTNDNQQRSELQGVAVTPADGTDLPNGTTAALFVTGTGNLSVDIESTNLSTGVTSNLTVAISAVPANSRLTLCCSRVRATGTTATGIFALYRAGNL